MSSGRDRLFVQKLLTCVLNKEKGQICAEYGIARWSTQFVHQPGNFFFPRVGRQQEEQRYEEQGSS